MIAEVIKKLLKQITEKILVLRIKRSLKYTAVRNCGNKCKAYTYHRVSDAIYIVDSYSMNNDGHVLYHTSYPYSFAVRHSHKVS